MTSNEISIGALFIAAVVAVVAVIVALIFLRTMVWSSLEHRNRLAHLTEVEFAELFVFIDPAKFLQWNLMAALALPTLTGLWFGWAVAGGVLLIVLIGPSAIYRRLKLRRRRLIEQQLPDVAAAMASSLRSGLALAQAIELVARYQPAPSAEEFALVLREQRLGVPLDQAMQGFSARVQLADAEMLVATLAIARELGSGLAEALERYSQTVRRRLLLEQRIRALTAQGKLQGMIMGALPLLLGSVLWWMQPQEMSRALTEPIGWAAIAVVVVLEIVGFVLIRRIVGINV